MADLLKWTARRDDERRKTLDDGMSGEIRDGMTPEESHLILPNQNNSPIHYHLKTAVTQ
jgi:hypothetical protein